MVTNGITPTRYTPLESLLFFQALRSQDLTSIDFGKISNELVTLPLVKNDASFDRDRLSADALQHFYLSLVKEEAREDTNSTLSNGAVLQNGDISPGSRKRKAVSPTLPSVEAAAKHTHLLPQLVTKLYARYRDTIVAEIKQEEKEIDRLDQEIKQYERGEFDEKLKLENGLSLQPPAEEEQISKAAPAESGRIPEPVVRPATAETHVSDQVKSDGRPRSARASIDALVNHTPDPVTARTGAHARQPAGAASVSVPHAAKGSLPPLSEMAPEHLTGPHVQPQGRPMPGQSPVQQHGQPPSPYQASQPVKHSSPYLPQYPMAAPSPPTQHQQPNQSPTSPGRMLPVPPGMQVQGSPVVQNGFQPPPPPGQMPMQPPHYGSPSQVRSSPVQGSTTGRGYPPQQQPYQYQQYQQYPGQQQAYMQNPQAQQQQPAYQIRPSQQGGFQLPPFQVSAQDPSKVRHQYQSQRATPQQNRYAQPPHPQGPPGGQSPYAQYSPFPQTPQQHSRLSLDSQRLTNSVIASLRRPRSFSTWKAQGHAPLQPPRSPTRPAAEPLSPVRPVVEPIQPPPEPPSSPPPDETPATKDSKQRKGSVKTARKARGSSVASSNIASSTRGRTRSQSVMSHPDASATDAPTMRTRRGARVDRSTPAELASDPAEAATGRATRTRRSTLQPPSSTVRPSPRGTPGPPHQEHREERKDVVYATRNFTRLSAVILDEISAHRHAGPFQKPVTEKEAEGYNDIIKQPQDLKSIKAAITAGAKAVNAAIAAKGAEGEGEDGDDAGGQTTGSTIMLPKTEDLLPPKGIVNSAQLEKEVMRMFANAVLFNPGDEGFVTDARQMAEDVARKVGDWREIETHEADAGGGQGSSKRRKL